MAGRSRCLSLIAGAFLMVAAPVSAQLVCPTLPGTSIRDYSKSCLRVDGEDVYPTYPGTRIRDYSKPGSVIRGNMIYPTYPGTNIRDYSKPGMRIDDR